MEDKNLNYLAVIKKLDALADPKEAKNCARFFKTGPGEYGEGDVFLGVRAPVLKKIAKQFKDLPLSDIKNLLKSRIHEHRFVALKILIWQYEKADELKKKKIVDFYLANTKRVNNWDLVDTSAPHILGDYLFCKNKNILEKLAKSQNIWERRIAIVSTLGFLKRGNYKKTLKIAKILLADEHDLIQKAVGWMLREVGKRSLEAEIGFLDKYYRFMPRTMLRYAIEKFPQKLRLAYLKKRTKY